MKKEIRMQLRNLFNMKVKDQEFFRAEIAALAEAISDRPVRKLTVVIGKFPGYGEASPERKAKEQSQRTVDRSILWSLFTDGARGNYIVYVDIP